MDGHILTRNAVFACIVLCLGGVALQPESAQASCNLIPGSRLSFTGDVGATNRPFAAPGEHLDVDLGIPASGFVATDYRVSVYYKPDALNASHLVVITDADGSGCSLLCSSPPTSLGYGDSCAIDLVSAPVAAASRCVELDDSGMESRAVSAEMFLSFSFPDSEDPGLFGLTLAGPAVIAVSKATAALPDLSGSACASVSGLDACVDVISDDDTFRHFVALPPPNDFALECVGDAPPCAPSLSSIAVAFDDLGNAFVPWNWSGVLIRHQGRPIPRLVTAELKLPFAIPDTSYLASYSPEGGILAPIFEPQFDPSAPPGSVTLFGSADAPYTILRIARGGLGLTSTGSAACMAPIYDPTIDFPGSGTGLAILPNDGLSACGGASPRVCLLSSGIPVSLQPAALTDELRAHLVDESVDAKARNADADVSDAVVLLQNRVNGVFQDLGTPLECGALPPGAAGRGSSMVAEPIFTDPFNPPSAPIEFAGVAAETDMLASIEWETSESCDINGTSGIGDHVLRVYQLSSGTVATELTAPSGCNVAGSAAVAVDVSPVIDDKALALSGGRVFYRGFPSGITGSGALSMLALDPLACSSDDLGATEAASASRGNAALLQPPSVFGAHTLGLYRSGSAVLGLGRHASAVSLDGRWLATLVSEPADSVDDNGDGDMSDMVARVYDLDPASAGFNVIAQAADAAVASGDFVVVATLEGAEGGSDINGDGDNLDRILQAYRADCPSGLDDACLVTSEAHALEIFSVGELDTGSCGRLQLVAFSVPEAGDAAADRNGDGDTSDSVLYVLDLLTGQTVSVGRSVVPCTFAECDPREPFKVEGSTVTFLTDEADEARDLNGDGSLNQVVVSVYDFCSDRSSTTASVTAANLSDTCASALRRVNVSVGSIADSRPPSQPGRSVVVITDAGRCVTAGQACGGAVGLGGCPAGSFCDVGECCPTTGRCLNFPDTDCVGDADCSLCALRYPATCRRGPCGQDLDCPIGSSCQASSIVAVVDSSEAASDSSSRAIPPTCVNETVSCAANAGLSDSLCGRSLAKIFTKLVRKADKLSARCHKKRNTDVAMRFVECNDVDDFDGKGVLAKFTAKFDKVAQRKCAGIDLSASNLICPRPCGGAFGVGAPLQSASDLASCLDCTARNFVEDRNQRILGRPLAPLSSKDDLKCHAAISKAYGKHLAEVLKNRDDCSGAALCTAAAIDPRIAKARLKAEQKLEKACGSVASLAVLDSCATTLVGLKSCLPSFSAPCGPSPWCVSACGSQTGVTTTTIQCSTTTTTTLTTP